ncbi:hypothetical protein DFJ74DRAFT_695108 [Hyaloraphidium curvatum]|nr:hypothetical protein DFJ74DRAFT_695108 [Hyaloraphidium curvatum]
MVSGGCVPAFIPLQIGYLFLSLFLDLVNMAAHNSQIADAVDLYRDAQRELRELALPARLSRNATALAALRGHDLVLSSYIEADRLRARILGFGVDYGLVRTLFVTVFTLAFGLWSILRGFGVVVTMDTVCRSG